MHDYTMTSLIKNVIINIFSNYYAAQLKVSVWHLFQLFTYWDEQRKHGTSEIWFRIIYRVEKQNAQPGIKLINKSVLPTHTIYIAGYLCFGSYFSTLKLDIN
jgi:hypothetical protein